MSAYYEDPEGKIRADFALRIGKLYREYERRLPSIPANERYEATLNLTLLHSLLTTCTELLKHMPERRKFDKPFGDVPALWGLRSDMVIRNTFPGKPSHFDVLERIRNALSHPTHGDVNVQYPTSGYRNINDLCGNQISAFSFVNSPDVAREGAFPTYDTHDKAEKKMTKLRSAFSKSGDHRPLKVEITSRNKYAIYCEGEPYVQIFQINIPMPALSALLLGLSNYLAQPTRDRWDGQSVVQLIA